MIKTEWIIGDKGIKDVHAIRRAVFIDEQHVPEEEELDGTDIGALHLLVYDENTPVATGRLLIERNDYVLGRIAVLKEHRGNGYGDLVVRMLIRKAYDCGGFTQYIHSQTHARAFYERFGFTAYGEEYSDAGIPHIDMSRTGDIAACC